MCVSCFLKKKKKYTDDAKKRIVFEFIEQCDFNKTGFVCKKSTRTKMWWSNSIRECWDVKQVYTFGFLRYIEKVIIIVLEFWISQLRWKKKIKTSAVVTFQGNESLGYLFTQNAVDWVELKRTENTRYHFYETGRK